MEMDSHIMSAVNTLADSDISYTSAVNIKKKIEKCAFIMEKGR